MEIIKTFPGEVDFHLFDELVKRLYPADSIRHQQTDKINEAFLVSCFVLVQDGNPKARVALYNNQELIHEEKHAFCIGNFECIQDQEIANHLIQHVIKEIKKQNGTYLIGPMNGSSWDNYRFSMHHDSPNFFLEPYHHLYYNDLFKDLGFEPISYYTSSMDTVMQFDYPDVLEIEIKLKNDGIIVREIDMNNYESELKNIFPLVIATFKNNFLYTPIQWEYFRDKYLQAAAIMKPENVLIAENSHGETIGLIFCYDDLSNQKDKSLIIKTIARNPSERYSGLGQVMGNQLIKSLNQRKYKSLIHAFMIESGVSTFASKKFHGNNYKKYVLYGKDI